MRAAFSLSILFLACANNNEVRSSNKPLPVSAPIVESTTKQTSELTTKPGAALSVMSATESFVILEGAAPDELVEIFCYNAKEGLFQSSQPCLLLIPPGSKISDHKGKTRSAGKVGPGADAIEACSPVSSTLYLQVKQEKGPKTRPGECFFWPETEAGLCDLLTTEDDLGAKRLSDKEREALQAMILSLNPSATKALVLKQAVSRDLDGDGVEDRFYSLTAGKLAGDESNAYPHYKFSGAFFVSGSSPEQLVLLARGDYSTFSLKQVFDINKDGKPELWLNILKAGDFSGYPPGTSKAGDFFGYPTPHGFELLTEERPLQSDIIFPGKG